jgi:hypothetical protein
MGVVGVGIVGVGGVMGFEVRGPVNVRSSVVLSANFLAGDFGGIGRGLVVSGTENADPMSERVSERTCMRSAGAMAGT